MQVWILSTSLDHEVHSYLKQLAHSVGTFINLPYSLAVRHQHYQCYLNAVASGIPVGSVYNIEVGPG